MVGNVYAIFVEVGSLEANKQNEPGEFKLGAIQYIIHPDYQDIYLILKSQKGYLDQFKNKKYLIY